MKPSPDLASDGWADLVSLAAQQQWYAQMGFVEKAVPCKR